MHRKYHIGMIASNKIDIYLFLYYEKQLKLDFSCPNIISYPFLWPVGKI